MLGGDNLGGTEEIELGIGASACSVCRSSSLAVIDKALGEGVPLRSIEAEYKIGRSSLSRHTAHHGGS